jgi:P27 family predicted phage terminase small subunit
MDTVALVLLCDTFAEYRKLRDQVEREGATYTLPTGMAKANPAMAMLSDSQKRLKSLLTEFGMTPSARSRVTVAGETPADPLEEFFAKRGRR